MSKATRGCAWLLSSAGGLCLFGGTAVAAQAPSPDTPTAQVEEIVVTAEHREASVQRTPIAISAVTGDTLRTKQITTFESLATTVPNLTFSRSGGDARLFIRGIGLDSIAGGADPRVAVYTDGVYNARVQAALSSFYDLERVEILSGPQGTLYGRNATAGAMNIIARAPGDHLNGYGTLTVGNYGLITTEGAVGGPLGGGLSARVAFQTADHGGYGRNLTNDRKYVDDQGTRSARATLVYDRQQGLELILRGDYFREDDHTGGYHFFGNTPGNLTFGQANGFAVPTNFRDVYGSGPKNDTKNYGASLTANVDIGGATLTSISAYRHLLALNLTNTDTTSSDYAVVNLKEGSNEYTQELRLTGTIGPVDLLGGAYYFYEKNVSAVDAPLNNAYFGGVPFQNTGPVGVGTQKTHAYAFFTQETVHFTPKLGLDVGVRYSHEKKAVDHSNSFNFTPLDPSVPLYSTDLPGTVFSSQAHSWSSWDPRATLHYQVSPAIYTYATYARGFKSGGFNLTAVQDAFAPERITDYEVGIKSDLLDHRLRANVAAFLYDYTNLQVNTTVGLDLITNNAGVARLKGIEADVTYVPTPDLRLALNVAYLDAKFKKYVTGDPGRPALGILDLAGNPLSYAPKLRVNGEIAYSFHPSFGDVTPRVETSWTSRQYFSQYKLPYIGQPEFARVDASIGYVSPDTKWSGNIFVKNLTNHFIKISSSVASSLLGYPIVGLLAPPRTFGASITRRF